MVCMIITLLSILYTMLCSGKCLLHHMPAEWETWNIWSPWCSLCVFCWLLQSWNVSNMGSESSWKAGIVKCSSKRRCRRRWSTWWWFVTRCWLKAICDTNLFWKLGREIWTSISAGHSFWWDHAILPCLFLWKFWYLWHAWDWRGYWDEP